MASTALTLKQRKSEQNDKVNRNGREFGSIKAEDIDDNHLRGNIIFLHHIKLIGAKRCKSEPFCDNFVWTRPTLERATEITTFSYKNVRGRPGNMSALVESTNVVPYDLLLPASEGSSSAERLRDVELVPEPNSLECEREDVGERSLK